MAKTKTEKSKNIKKSEQKESEKPEKKESKTFAKKELEKSVKKINAKKNKDSKSKIQENSSLKNKEKEQEHDLLKMLLEDINSHHYGNILFGLTVVFVGFYLLGRNFGFIPAGLDVEIIRLWPVLIIFVGISILIPKK